VGQGGVALAAFDAYVDITLVNAVLRR